MKFSFLLASALALLIVNYGIVVPWLMSYDSIPLIVLGVLLGALPIVGLIGFILDKELKK